MGQRKGLRAGEEHYTGASTCWACGQGTYSLTGTYSYVTPMCACVDDLWIERSPAVIAYGMVLLRERQLNQYAIGDNATTQIPGAAASGGKPCS
jgi:hypothetical protein